MRRSKFLLEFRGRTIIVNVCACIGLITLSILAGCKSVHSDDDLQRTFFEHRTEFEQIKAMLEQDTAATSVAMRDSRTFPPSGQSVRGSLSKDRLHAYRRLFRRVGVQAAGNQQPNMTLESDLSGTLLSSQSKGYAYLNRPPSVTYGSLDDIYGGNCQALYKPLKDNWYLYYRDCYSNSKEVTHGQP